VTGESAASDAARLLARLAERGWSVGVAESLTGGLVVASLVSVPGASAHVRGGIVAYATDLKAKLLGVDAALLAEHGAVHPEVARQMADGVRAAVGAVGEAADVGISTTGIAGPDSPDGQPVGTVHVGVATPEGTRVESLILDGDRDEIRAEAVRRALLLALDAL
jgi:nicotinamide-nucleotide amidase